MRRKTCPSAAEQRHARDRLAEGRVVKLGWTVARAARAAGITERHLHRRLRGRDVAAAELRARDGQ